MQAKTAGHFELDRCLLVICNLAIIFHKFPLPVEVIPQAWLLSPEQDIVPSQPMDLWYHSIRSILRLYNFTCCPDNSLVFFLKCWLTRFQTITGHFLLLLLSKTPTFSPEYSTWLCNSRFYETTDHRIPVVKLCASILRLWKKYTGV